MKRLLPLILLLGCGTRSKPNGPPEPTIEVQSRTYRLEIVHGRKAAEALREDGRARLVVYGHPKYHHYVTDEKFDVLFVDADGTVLEILSLEGQEGGITSGVETARALFLPPGSGARAGEKLALPEVPGREEGIVELGSHRVYVEVSRSIDERSRGLMWRRKLSADDGMLFVYEYPDLRRFWMGNCYIDLDIAFFREDGSLINVVETRRYEDPSSDPPERSCSLEPAKYVLETNFGWFRAHGLSDADGKPVGEVRMQWRR